CRYASPDHANGESCEPTQVKAELDDVSFEAFEWPEDWPESRAVLDLNEVALPESENAGFVELRNTSQTSLDLAEFSVEVSPQPPGTPWPTQSEGLELAAPAELTL